METRKENKSILQQKFPIITDQKIIAGLDKLPLYVPAHESPMTYDTDMMNRDSYKASAEVVGQLRHIEVAVWFDDPEIDVPNSHARVHLRIINGRHRYMQDPTWKRDYYDLSQFPDPVMAYFDARLHFDLQKRRTASELSMIIEEMAERLLKTTGIDAEDCCNEIVNIMHPQGLGAEATIRNACPSRYKDKEHAGRKTGKTFADAGRDTKEIKIAKKKLKVEEKEKRIKELEETATKFESRIISLEDGMKVAKHETDKLESKIRILSNLEATETIDGINIHAVVDADKNKIVISKVENP